MGRPAHLAALVLVTCALAPAGADARSVIPLPAPHGATSVVLSPTGAWVALADRNFGTDGRVVELTPGALTPFPAFDPLLDRASARDPDQEVFLDGSPLLLALTSSRTVWAAATAGDAPQELVDCSRALRSPLIDVSGTVVAREAKCIPRNGDIDLSDPIVVKDVATGETRTIKPRRGEALLGFQLAGGYLAVDVADIGDNPESEDTSGVAVIDWHSGRELLRVPNGPEETNPMFDVTPEGILAIAQTGESSDPTGPCERGPQRFEWWSLADPRAHAVRLRSDVCLEGDLKLAGGAVLGKIRRRGHPDKPLLQGLDGSPPLTLAEGEGAIDFDGSRIARIRGGCAAEQLVLDDIASIRANGLPEPEQCPFELGPVPKRIRLGNRRTFDIAFSCPAGCREGILGVEWVRRTAGEGYVFIGRPGKPGRVRISVPRGVRRSLRQHGHLDVRLRAELREPDGSLVRRSARTRLLP